MAARLNPYLGFADNAREAMEFYQGVFGGELQISTFGEYGARSDGGAVTVRLDKQVWRDEFGMRTDRFGTTWMVNIAQPEG